MNKNDVITEIAYRLRTTYRSDKNNKFKHLNKKTIAEIINTYEQVICDAINRNDIIALSGFMKIERMKRKGHKGNDLNGNGLIDIPDYEIVKITPGVKFKKDNK